MSIVIISPQLVMGVVWQEKDGELVEGAGNDRGGGGRWREQGMIEEVEGGGGRLWLSVSALGCLWRTEVCTERQSIKFESSLFCKC